MKNVYLVGKAGSGKTYSANYLKDKYGYQTAKFAFPVYGIAEDYFGMRSKDRRLLQIIGTEAGRNIIDYDLWVTRFLQDMRIVQESRRFLNLPSQAFVLDDCRFPNEHRALRRDGWVGIYLFVDEDTRIRRLVKRDGTAQEETLNHYSETASDEFKSELFYVDCNGTLEESYRNLDEVIQDHVIEKE